jgi:hypothetical protein
MRSIRLRLALIGAAVFAPLSPWLGDLVPSTSGVDREGPLWLVDHWFTRSRFFGITFRCQFRSGSRSRRLLVLFSLIDDPDFAFRVAATLCGWRRPGCGVRSTRPAANAAVVSDVNVAVERNRRHTCPTVAIAGCARFVTADLPSKVLTSQTSGKQKTPIRNRLLVAAFPLAVGRDHPLSVTRTGTTGGDPRGVSPRLRASGAEGPWRAGPNHVVVVPTGTDVRLSLQTRRWEWALRVASACTVVFGVGTGVLRKRRRPRQ